MVVPSHQVVSPSPGYQGSVLGRIVAGDGRLGQLLYWIAFSNANKRLLASVQAELAALRQQQHAKRLNTFLTLREDAALRCREAVCIESTPDRSDIPLRAKLAATQPLPPNCKHGLLVICCAICKKQKDGGCVDARGSAEAYKEIQKLNLDKPWCGFACCAECGQRFVNDEGEPTILQFAFCGETLLKQGDCKHAWLAKHPSLCELSKPEPKWVDGLAVHREGERQAASQCHSFTHSGRSHVERALHEKKLFANVAAYQQNDNKLIEEARQLKKAAGLYWQFCVAFEFPIVCDQDAMEKAVEHLINVVPREYLELLFSQRKGKRHYVRHGAADLSFVRKQDLELATNF